MCLLSRAVMLCQHGQPCETQVLLSAGDYRTCFEAKAEAVAAALISGEYDFAFLHVKAVDDAGHDKAPALKVRPHQQTRCTPSVTVSLALGSSSQLCHACAIALLGRGRAAHDLQAIMS